MNQPPSAAQQLAYAAGAARQALEIGKANAASLDAITAILKKTTIDRPVGGSWANPDVAAGGSAPNLQYIENIPGRRVPFDFTATIPIGTGVNTVQQSTIQVSQEGPFVAVARYASFLSQYQLQYTDPETLVKSNFFGRSYGRHRPISSICDAMDGMPRQQVLQSAAYPGTGGPHILSPSNGSPFRSMETDFAVTFLNAGSSFPRSNAPVPSSLWMEGLNKPSPLPALDFFERGEQLQFNVQPLHVNNPSYGNVQQFASGNGAFPFLASGWDYIEGINDVVNGAAGTTDPIARLPDGILIIGFWGYKIVQPAGSGPY